MSQPTAAPPPPAPAVAPAPGPPGAAAPYQPQAAVEATPAVVDTPKLLNRWQLIGMTVAIVFGLLSALLQFLGWQTDGRAAADAEQLVRVQGIQSSLLRADALATNAFLQGGLEDPEQREEYDAAIDGALKQITEAADAQPADREALAALNVEVNDYDAAIAQARTNNRLGYPVGAEYLSSASDDLRATALPILEALAKANNERAERAMGGQHPWWLLLIGVLALVGLWWVNRELARHFRRRINVGVAIAAAIVLVVTLVTTFLAAGRGGDNNDLLDGSFRVAVDEAAARTAANDAKAMESLRLIKRGAGGAFETNWAGSADIVEDRASRESAQHWETYVERHKRIVELDNAGDWAGAVQIATTTDEAEGSTEPLDDFDTASQRVIDEAGTEATDQLRSGRGFALVLTLLTMLLGITAAVFVSRGIGERRREYA